MGEAVSTFIHRAQAGWFIPVSLRVSLWEWPWGFGPAASLNLASCVCFAIIFIPMLLNYFSSFKVCNDRIDCSDLFNRSYLLIKWWTFIKNRYFIFMLVRNTVVLIILFLSIPSQQKIRVNPNNMNGEYRNLDLTCGFTDDFTSFIEKNSISSLIQITKFGVSTDPTSNVHHLAGKQAAQSKSKRFLLSLSTGIAILVSEEEPSMATDPGRLASEVLPHTWAPKDTQNPSCTQPHGETRILIKPPKNTTQKYLC